MLQMLVRATLRQNLITYESYLVNTSMWTLELTVFESLRFISFVQKTFLQLF